MIDEKQKQLEEKYIDYQRFVGALLILASYLFLGAMIYTYIRPSDDGKWLLGLTLLALAVGFWFTYKQRRIKKTINEKR
ncbi:YrhC family protein [Virgibacillus proomii]|uniref:YrhC family protein n=1 Tax=Virgibacillus proomii TaxID=84407 RepID=UPI001C10B577|nr:YrhC family protein [Virgibacillus proomii]MBU5265825.1 YrhC family protein [Virgibacillus proomii]